MNTRFCITNRFSLLIAFWFFVGMNYSCRKTGYTVEVEEAIRDNGAGTGTVTWTSDKSYVIEGLVFVNDGQTLTIEAGTVIRARTGHENAASALIVARGGKIYAMGTPSEPIIFTCEGDDLQGAVPIEAQGLWGGVIILGGARLNSKYGENSIEGIPISEPRGIYGGIDDEDNSGILQYVSIRHGGTNIGEGNEINGLTMGGVGNGTTIEHVEVISNADDGFEFFGGTVNCRYLLAAFCGDDAFDYDEGYRGKGQFWAGIQAAQHGDLLLEADGGIFPENGHPLSSPDLHNLTLVGGGTGTERQTAVFSRNAAGSVCNSIIVNQSGGVFIEFKEGLEDSYEQFDLRNLSLRGNVFYDISGNITDSIFQVFSDDLSSGLEEQRARFREHFLSGSNKVEDPGILYEQGAYHMISGEYQYTGLVGYPDEWFEPVSFQGAFGTFNWASGWTHISQEGILRD